MRRRGFIAYAVASFLNPALPAEPDPRPAVLDFVTTAVEATAGNDAEKLNALRRAMRPDPQRIADDYVHLVNGKGEYIYTVLLRGGAVVGACNREDLNLP